MKRQIVTPLIALLLTGTAHAETAAPRVTRTAPDALTLTWAGTDPVDVYVSADPEASPAKARLVSPADRDGTETVKVSPGDRAYFLLKDRKTGTTRQVAERLLPLEQGSNFRDLGGYGTTGGKHVRWGLIYRSGGQPMLTPADVKQIAALKLASLVDLRSN